MPTNHVSETPLLAKIEGGLRFGNEQSMLVDGDLASTIAAAKSAVDTDNANLHVSHKTFGVRIKSALDLVDNYDSTYKNGSSALKSTMIALSPARNGGQSPRF